MQTLKHIFFIFIFCSSCDSQTFRQYIFMLIKKYECMHESMKRLIL